jgi:hypothetical protein
LPDGPKKLGGKLKLSEYFRNLIKLEEARSSLHPTSRQGDLLWIAFSSPFTARFARGTIART